MPPTHDFSTGLLPGMTGEADWTAGCTWETSHCDVHYWSTCVVGGYMLYDTLIVLHGLEQESNGVAQTVAHHVIAILTIPPGALHNAVSRRLLETKQ